MNPDAFSDLLLALLCFWLFQRNLRIRPGVAVALLIIGISAAIGTLRFAGIDALLGPHRFATLFTTCAAFALLAFALAWPADPLVAKLTGAARFALFTGALGVAFTVSGLRWWSTAMPMAAAIALLITMLRPVNALGLVGTLLLVSSFASTLLIPPDALYWNFLSRPQVLHYLLASALAALVYAPARRAALPAGPSEADLTDRERVVG
jgi:hypothetical protein